MNHDGLFSFNRNKKMFEGCSRVSSDNQLFSIEEFPEEITNVFDGLEDVSCRSELSSLSDSDYSEPSEKPARKQLVIGSHIKITEDRNQKYTCTICACSFSRKQQVRYHDYCVTGKRPLKCELCGKGFIKKSHLTYHVRTHTGETPFKCSICHKGFKQKSKLTRHERTHDSGSRLLCHFCKKSYSDKDSLRKHEQKHNEDIYKCPTCRKSYADKFSLKQHLSLHKGPNYICDVCGKSFLRRNSLNVHMQIHDDIYPFECGSCQRTFRNKKELKQHSIIHDKNNPGHECEICSITCGRRDNLLRHIRNCHLDPCPKKVSSSYKDSCPKVIDLHEQNSLKFSNKVSFLNSAHDGVTSKETINEVCSEKRTSQSVNNNSKKNNLTDSIEAYVSDKTCLKLDNSSKVIDKCSKAKQGSEDLPQNKNEVNAKANGHLSKEINHNPGLSIQTILNESMHNQLFTTAEPNIVKSLSECDIISSRKTSQVEGPEAFIKYNSLGSKTDKSVSLKYPKIPKGASVQSGQSIYNKFNTVMNGADPETSVIKHTDAFRDIIISSNLLREPVIKSARSSIVFTDDLNLEGQN